MAAFIRDIAKIMTGVAVSETIGHWWLGLIGTRFLPLDLGWFTFTREANWVAMGGWPLVLLVCIWTGWWRSVPKGRDDGGSSRAKSSA